MAERYELEWDGGVVSEHLHSDLRRGLGDALEHLLGVANVLVPLDEGPLMHSGVTSMDDTALKGAVAYDKEYAVYQHERLDLRHLPGRQAKYLETPFNTERPVMLELIAAPAQRRAAT